MWPVNTCTSAVFSRWNPPPDSERPRKSIRRTRVNDAARARDSIDAFSNAGPGPPALGAERAFGPTALIAPGLSHGECRGLAETLAGLLANFGTDGHRGWGFKRTSRGGEFSLLEVEDCGGRGQPTLPQAFQRVPQLVTDGAD